MAEKYLGPSRTLDGKEVPADGLSVNYSPEQIAIMRQHGHRFASDTAQAPKPTPEAVNAAVNEETGEADLAKATKATAKDAAADKP
jgi:hypothetical protein